VESPNVLVMGSQYFIQDYINYVSGAEVVGVTAYT